MLTLTEEQKRRRWLALGIVALAYVLSFFQRFAPAGIAQDLATAFSTSAASLGVLLLTAVFMFWQAQDQVEQLASEDSALLSEALPPNALLDKGFQSWVSSGTPDVQ